MTAPTVAGQATILCANIGASSLVPVEQLHAVLAGIFCRVQVICTASEENLAFVRPWVVLEPPTWSRRLRAFGRITAYARSQLWLGWKVLVAPCPTVWVFFIGGESLPLVIALARLRGGKVVLASAGAPAAVARANGRMGVSLLTCMERLSLTLVHCAILYSRRIATERGLQRFAAKICVARKHYVDVGVGEAADLPQSRDRVVCFAGALATSKGVPQLLEAIPRVLEIFPDVRFIIVGKGPLQSRVAECVEEWGGQVWHAGFLSHGELMTVLRKAKLLVLPSSTEGLPNVVLEAITCRTPVLATPVGAIPDVVVHRRTGFLLEDSSADSIVKGIQEVLEFRDLNRVSMSALNKVCNEFTLRAAVGGYRSVFRGLGVIE